MVKARPCFIGAVIPYPLVPIIGFICCTETGLSMAADPEMLSGFIGCLLFMVACYASYYWLYHNKN